jgi:hypothetical protein
MKQCLICKIDFDDIYTFCNKCHGPLSEITIETREEDTKACPSCKKLNELVNVCCKYCGEDFPESIEKPEVIPESNEKVEIQEPLPSVDTEVIKESVRNTQDGGKAKEQKRPSSADKFRDVMHAIVNRTAYASKMPAMGLNACLDDLLWFNLNRGSGERQDEIRSETENIVRAIGGDRNGGIPNGNTTNQNAGKFFRKIHPQSIESILDDGTIMLNIDVLFKASEYINSLPEDAKYIWAVLSYIEGFTYLIPGALQGNDNKLNEAKKFLNIALLFCPDATPVKETLEQITQIENALQKYNEKALNKERSTGAYGGKIAFAIVLLVIVIGAYFMYNSKRSVINEHVPSSAPAPAPAPAAAVSQIKVIKTIIAKRLDSNNEPIEITNLFDTSGFIDRGIVYYTTLEGMVSNNTSLQTQWYRDDNLYYTSPLFTPSYSSGPYYYNDDNFNFIPGNYEVRLMADDKEISRTTFTVLAKSENKAASPSENKATSLGERKYPAVEQPYKQTEALRDPEPRKPEKKSFAPHSRDDL